MARKKSTRQPSRWRAILDTVKNFRFRRPRGGSQRRKSSRSGTARRRWQRAMPALPSLRDLPAQWREFTESLPPWTDEVAGILLIVFGVVSLLALLNFSPDTTVASSWAYAIRQLFGYGGFVVALGILALGVIILLPKLGIVLRFPWPRVLAIEIAFISFLALLHLLANDPEPRALARAGGGGGYVGWALSQLVVGLFDPITSTLLYAAVFIVALSRAIGLRRRHLERGLEWLSDRLRKLADTVEGRAMQFEATAEGIPTPESAASVMAQRSRPSIVPRHAAPDMPRVRPIQGEDHAEGAGLPEEPPSLFADTLNYVQPDPEKVQRGLSSPGVPGTRPSVVPRSDKDEEKPYRPVLWRPKSRRARVKKVRDAEGRLVRYFRVDDLQEPRRVGKRASYLPPLDLLDERDLNRPTDEEINENARIIEETLREFDVHVEVIDVRIGPAVTQYAVQPFKEIVNEQGERVLQRVRVGRISALERDLALALSARRLRIQAPVPGFSYVGVEVPNKQPSIVSLRGVMESTVFYRTRSPLALPLGRDVSGTSVVADLATMPHLLVAGTTGSGKSVALTSMATALVMNNSPDNLKLVMLDPKMVELSRFNGLPHLLGPVETDQERILGVLRWATREMDRRYKLLEVEAARNLQAYNKALGRRRRDEHLPYIVIIFDEIGDLMLSRPDETEKTLARLAQMARAVGIHLIVATQRPSVDVITGLIKANFPARISFAVASSVDSRVILDSVGAETLMGRGDMLYQASDAAGPRRIQGCFVSDEEIDAVVTHWAGWLEEQVETGQRDAQTIAPWERGMTRRELLSETDPMLEAAIQLVVEAGEASASLIQRRLGVGYPRAARLMDLMHELGIIGAERSGGRTREVLFKAGDDPFKQLIDRRIHGG